MVKVKNVFGDEYSGQVGKAGVFANWKGIQYRRKYVIPANPNTPAQQAVRADFTNGVDKWHSFDALQSESYKPLASGQAMSGFNLFMSRWMKLGNTGRANYVSPYVGFYQLADGAVSGSQTATNTTNVAETVTANKPIVRGSLTYSKGSGTHDPVAVIDIERGRIDFLKAVTGAITASYSSQGEAVSNEIVKTNASIGDVAYLEHFPVDYKTAHIKVAGTEVDAIELDVNNGKIYVCNTSTFTGGSTYTFSKFTPATDVKLALVKANTNFSTFAGYSDANGEVKVAQTAEDGNRDRTISSAEYISLVNGNLSALASANDQLIVLTHI